LIREGSLAIYKDFLTAVEDVIGYVSRTNDEIETFDIPSKIGFRSKKDNNIQWVVYVHNLKNIRIQNEQEESTLLNLLLTLKGREKIAEYFTMGKKLWTEPNAFKIYLESNSPE
jgi:hypothetical protein